jgi:hypothetical protein
MLPSADDRISDRHSMKFSPGHVAWFTYGRHELRACDAHSCPCWCRCMHRRHGCIGTMGGSLAWKEHVRIGVRLLPVKTVNMNCGSHAPCVDNYCVFMVIRFSVCPFSIMLVGHSVSRMSMRLSSQHEGTS